jgi:hypothetical protein
MPSFDLFCERLTTEQSKLLQLDALFGSKNQYLVAHTYKSKHKTRYKQNKGSAQVGESTSKPQQKSKSFSPSSNSGDSSSKTRKKKSSETYNFCGGLGHAQSKYCLKLEALIEVVRQHKI